MKAWVPTGRSLGTGRQVLALIWIAHGFHGVLGLHARQNPTILQSSSSPLTNQNALNRSSPAGSAALQANEIVYLASLFDSAECKRSISDANYNRWKQTVQPPNPARLGEMQQTYFIQKYKSMYVRNQKAGSNFLVRELREAFNSKVIKDKVLLSGSGSMYPQEIPSQHHEPADTIFSVVSHPAKTAFSGYSEVSARNGLGQPDPLPTYRSMPCGSMAQDMARYKAFLRAIHSGEPLGPEAFHVFPQALKIDIDVRRGRRKFDFIAKLDNLHNDLQIIAARIGMIGFQGLDDASKGEAHSHANSRCRNIDFDDEELALMMCDLYMPDYVCFGYDIPAACRSKYSGAAPHGNRSLAATMPAPIEINGTSAPMETNATSVPIEVGREPAPVQINPVPVPVEINQTAAPVQVSGAPTAPVQINPVPVPAGISQAAAPVQIGGAPRALAAGTVPKPIDLNDTVLVSGDH